MAVDSIDGSTTSLSRRSLELDEHAPSMSTVSYGQASLRYGMKGPAVEQLHQRLTGAGFPVSGDRFGAKTLDAVKGFQKSRGLDATGVVGLHTMEAFESSFEPFRKAPVALTPPSPPATSVGSATHNPVERPMPPTDTDPAARTAARQLPAAPQRSQARPARRASRARRTAAARQTRRSASARRAQPARAPATPQAPTPGAQPAAPAAPAGQPGQYERLATQRLGADFVAQAKQVAQRIGVTPEALFAMMNNESGLDPKAVNRGSGATGLIQFMPATARALGTTTAALKSMSATQQLAYVERYFQPYKGKIHNATDLYIATFYPAALGRPDSWVMGGQNGTAGAVARANPIFDLNRDGQITAGEFREYYRRRFPNVT